MQSVLIADDDPLMLRLLEHRLTVAGFRVIPVADGEQVCSTATDEQPDLIVLDWMMPGSDGLYLLQELKRAPATAKIPIVMLTARKHEADIVRAFSLGARDYLVKPFSPAELLVRVNNILGAGQPA